MSSNSRADASIGMLVDQKRVYREHVRSLSLGDRLRRLEALQEQTYEILRIREANGGSPIPVGWKRWAKAQESYKK